MTDFEQWILGIDVKNSKQLRRNCPDLQYVYFVLFLIDIKKKKKKN